MLRLALAIGLAAVSTAALADGRTAYAMKCAGCHGAGGVGTPGGPALRGVTGRKIAAVAGYKYSAALKARRGVWDAAMLDAYVANPSKTIQGTTMFTGVSNAAERASIIAYLKTLR